MTKLESPEYVQELEKANDEARSFLEQYTYSQRLIECTKQLIAAREALIKTINGHLKGKHANDTAS